MDKGDGGGGDKNRTLGPNLAEDKKINLQTHSKHNWCWSCEHQDWNSLSGRKDVETDETHEGDQKRGNLEQEM